MVSKPSSLNFSAYILLRSLSSSIIKIRGSLFISSLYGKIDCEENIQTFGDCYFYQTCTGAIWNLEPRFQYFCGMERQVGEGGRARFLCSME